MTLLDLYESLYLKDNQQLKLVEVNISKQEGCPVEPKPEKYDDLIPYFNREVISVAFQENIITVSLDV